MVNLDHVAALRNVVPDDPDPRFDTAAAGGAEP